MSDNSPIPTAGRKIVALRAHEVQRERTNVVWAALAGAAAALIAAVAWHRSTQDTLMHAALVAALGPAIGAAVVAFYRLSFEPSELRWDERGFTYVKGENPVAMSWSDFEGFKVTHGRLKIRKKSGPSITVELPDFSDDDQAAILTELGRRSPTALPLH